LKLLLKKKALEIEKYFFGKFDENNFKKYIEDVIDFLSQEEFLSGIDKETALVVEKVFF